MKLKKYTWLIILGLVGLGIYLYRQSKTSAPGVYRGPTMANGSPDYTDWNAQFAGQES